MTSPLQLLADWKAMTIEERRAFVRKNNLPQKWVEVPVDLKTFIEDKRFLGHPPLSKIQFEFVTKMSELFDIEAAQRDQTEVTFLPDQQLELVACWGKGSGKNSVVVIAVARVLYLLGCLLSPHEVLGIPEHSSIDILNIALNKEQATENFFDPLKRLVNKSEWFSERLLPKILDERISVPPVVGYDKDLGDMYAINAWAGHSGAESMEGKTLLLAVADEIDAFRSEKSSQSKSRTRELKKGTAEHMYEMLATSVRSRFPKIGKVGMISWPRSAKGFLMRRLELGLNDPQIFASGPYATWEVHPLRTREDFDFDFRNNPEMAQAKYGANPGEVVGRYFADTLAVLEAFHAKKIPGRTYGYMRDPESPGPEPPIEEAAGVILGENVPSPQYGATYCWHGDLALSGGGDRAAIAMAHHSGYHTDEEGDRVPIITVDAIGYWESTADTEIDYLTIRQLILRYARHGYVTGRATFDGFQSADMMQRIRDHDTRGAKVAYSRHDGTPLTTPIESVRYSLDTSRAGYDTLKSLIYEGRLKAFYCGILVEELLGLVTTKNGKKIDHTDSSSKDLADAVAGAVLNALDFINPQLDRGNDVSSFSAFGNRQKGEVDKPIDRSTFLTDMRKSARK